MDPSNSWDEGWQEVQDPALTSLPVDSSEDLMQPATGSGLYGVDLAPSPVQPTRLDGAARLAARRTSGVEVPRWANMRLWGLLRHSGGFRFTYFRMCKVYRHLLYDGATSKVRRAHTICI